MKLRRPVRHAIFDLDGVLLDTEPIYTDASNAVAARYGKQQDWSIKANMIGRPAIDAARYFVEALDLPISAEEYLAARGEYLHEHLLGAGRMPAAEQFTRELFRRGIPLAVATSTEAKLFDLKIAGHRPWFSIFSAVICGDDPRVLRGKPAPDIFLLAARELGADPASCVVFEDSPFGVAAALAAGMQVVALPDPHMDLSRYAGADVIVSGFDACALSDLGL
jgi:pseudouridine-5'-monophosphatase